MKRYRTKFSRGHAIAEFAIVLPLLFILILTAVEFALTGVRSFVVAHAAMRAARVAAVYQQDFANAELYAMLPPSLFSGGFVDETIGDHAVKINAVAAPLVKVRALDRALLIERSSPGVLALPQGVSDAVLQGGDTPSPYCNERGGYGACGYPE